MTGGPLVSPEALLVQAAADEGVALGALAPCWQTPHPRPGVIVGFGSIADDQLRPALETLGHVLSCAAKL